MESQKAKLLETWSEVVIHRDRGRVGEIIEGSQRVKNLSYKINKILRCKVQNDDYS